MSDYPVVEAFHTLQGEGAHTGRAAWFIRLAGCDVRCVWCDSPQSWGGAWPRKTAAELASAVPLNGTFAVITGGEPLLHDLTALTDALHARSVRVHVETSGTQPLTGAPDWICLSPKKQKPPLTEVCERADELKVIIADAADFEWAEQQAARVSDTCRLFLQPEWSVREAVMPLIADFVKDHPRWRVSLQTHKYLDIP